MGRYHINNDQGLVRALHSVITSSWAQGSFKGAGDQTLIGYQVSTFPVVLSPQPSFRFFSVLLLGTCFLNAFGLCFLSVRICQRSGVKIDNKHIIIFIFSKLYPRLILHYKFKLKLYSYLWKYCLESFFEVKHKFYPGFFCTELKKIFWLY